MDSATNRSGWVDAAKRPAALLSTSSLADAWTSWKYSASEVEVMTSVSLWERRNGTARLEPAVDRGVGGQHPNLPAAGGRNDAGLGHGVAGGRRQGRLHGHGATLRRTATTRQATQPEPPRG